jgi:glycosyltransferase involved in cell wall biosynthesis/SAM-dependent methyltransferase
VPDRTSPVRVLSVGAIPPEWGGPRRGGVATFHATLVEALQPGSGAPTAEVVAVASPGAQPSDWTPVPIHALDGGDVHRSLARVLESVEADVVLVHHVTTRFAAALPEVAAGLPVVGIAHSWHALSGVSGAVEAQVRERAAQALSGMAAVVYGSEHARREGEGIGIPHPERVEVILYPLQPALIEPIDTTRTRRGVVFAGNLEARKRPLLLVEAAAAIPDLELVFAGEGPERDAILGRAAELGVAERVTVPAPPPSTEELIGLLAGAEVLCVPSSSETFGLVYTEALACGTPVVGFAPTLAEIAGALGTDIGEGVLDVGGDDLGRALERVRAAPRDRADLRARTLDAFTPRRAAERYARLLADVAGRAEIERRVAGFAQWHYAFDLGGIRTPIRDETRVNRHEQRRRYFFDRAVERLSGSLKGRRVLDLGCNAGFWSLAAIEAGAEHVLGLDARPMHVEQAELVFSARGVDPDRYEFRCADIYDVDLTAEGPFDLVLFLGLLYHVHDPVGLFERLRRWTSELLVVDTTLSTAAGSTFELVREPLDEPRNAARAELVLVPTRQAVLDVGEGSDFDVEALEPAFTSWEGSEDYRDGRRLAFLATPRAPGAEPAAARDPAFDVAGFRAGRRAVELRPYERVMEDSDEEPKPGRGLETTLAGRWQLANLPEIELAPPLAWDEICASNRSWSFHLHAWEPLGDLIMAAPATEDPAAPIRLAVDLALDWLQAYPTLETDSPFAWYDMGVGLRAYRLAYLIDHVARDDAYDDDVVRRLVEGLRLHMESLADDDNFAGHSNHGFYQAAGQLAAARRLSELPGMAAHQAQADARLRDTVDRHFTAEGVHKEHSPDYHWMVGRAVTAIVRANLVDDAWLREADARIQSSLAWFIQPNERVAMFGDSNWRRCRLPRHGEDDEPALSFMTSGGTAGRPPDEAVRGFEESGYFVARDRWPEGPDDFASTSYLAQIAAFHSYTHKHPDHGAFIWYDDARELVVEAGRFGYLDPTAPGSDLRRQGFRYGHPKRLYVESTRAHNVVEIDGRSYERRGVPRFGSALRHWGERDGLAYSEVGLSHRPGIAHARVLVFAPGQWLVVVDRLYDRSRTPHRFVQRFHFAAELDLAGTDPVGLRAEGMTRTLWMIPLLGGEAQEPLEPVRGQEDPELLGWVSRRANELEPVWTGGFSADGTPSHVFATLLCLAEEPPEPDAAFNAANASGRRVRLRWRGPGGLEQIRLNRENDGLEVERRGAGGAS